MKRILIVGATSAIAEAAARVWAAQGHGLYLVGRARERLQVLAADLRVRGASQAACSVLDVTELERHAEVLDAACAALGGIDIVLVAHGTLPDQAACEQDAALALREFHVNATATIALLTLLANRLQAQGQGTIAVITSVAGDRGRQSNYLYGSAKAAVATFLQGLRNRLHHHGVRVLTIKPGFVDTPMTAAFPKGPLWASPEAVGRAIARAVERGAEVAYVPGFWLFIMLAIRHIPERVFKRMRL